MTAGQIQVCAILAHPDVMAAKCVCEGPNKFVLYIAGARNSILPNEVADTVGHKLAAIVPVTYEITLRGPCP